MGFFDTNTFVGVATLVTGFGAFGVYSYQKKDTKIKAARVLLTEIRSAEERIDQIRDKIIGNNMHDLPTVFPSNNWNNYSHLFIKDFDQDELKLLNEFYDYGEIIEDFAKRNNNYFWITTEERAKVTTQKIAQFINDSFGTPDPDKNILDRRIFLSKQMDNHNEMYAPVKTFNGIKDYLSKIQKITTSSCGAKLKRLAGF